MPDKALARAVCFISMMSLSFAHVLLLTFSFALLAMTKTSWLLYFLGIDMVLFFVYKIVRRDFYYFLNVEGLLRCICAIFSRIGAKIMANFTLMLQLRHPNEMGGLPFLFSIVYSLVGSFTSVYLYSTHHENDDKLSQSTLQTVLGSLVAIWVVSLVSFALVIKREYLHTFYAADTSSTYNRKEFLILREDQEAEKSGYLTLHPDVYKPWSDVVKKWTFENWKRWEEEKPALFTNGWIDGVPNDFIPFEFRVIYKKTMGRVDNAQLKRRRGTVSVKELMGGKEDR